MKKFLKFIISSITSSILDITIAWLLMDCFIGIINNDFIRIGLASGISRIISTIVNYVINKKLVFNEGDKQVNNTGYRFIILTVFIVILSTIGVYLISNNGILNEKLAKPVVDAMLFFVSYVIQVKWVFKQRS